MVHNPGDWNPGWGVDLNYAIICFEVSKFKAWQKECHWQIEVDESYVNPVSPTSFTLGSYGTQSRPK